jgi:hypothetical protein
MLSGNADPAFAYGAPTPKVVVFGITIKHQCDPSPPAACFATDVVNEPARRRPVEIVDF